MGNLKYIFSRKAFTFLLVIAAVFGILFSAQYSLKVFADGKQSKGSTIGGVAVSGLKDDEIKAALRKAIQKWSSEPILIRGGGEELSIDPEDIQFDLNQTIQEYRKSIHKPFYQFWKSEKTVHIPIHISNSETIKNQISYITIWDTEDTYNRVLNEVSYLNDHEIDATVIDTEQLENERIALTIEKIPDNATGVEVLAETLNENILEPDEPFSLLNALHNLTDAANAEGLNFVASVIYNTVLQGNIDILERHPQQEAPSYLQPGINAYIDPFGKNDLQFVNVSEHPYLLKATVEGGQLKAELFSSVKGATVQVVVDKEPIAPRIINRYTRDLPAGSTRLIQEGKQGMRVTVTRMISDNGEQKVQEISRDYYAPVNRIVLNSASDVNFGGGGTVEEQGKSAGFGSVENVDLNGDGLPDYDSRNDGNVQNPKDNPKGNPKGEPKDESSSRSYYDKGGNLVTS
ncbi:vancomycin resistance protein [Ureibacillus terrenus]|uniref:Vancomycin resistance protein n=1 Tax=Ureibacillus terrenus TaxID=118246 RepID=A0A540V6S3_9BACL|nr:vancomycin resistance protein [Ureibacillus terrenus]